MHTRSRWRPQPPCRLCRTSCTLSRPRTYAETVSDDFRAKAQAERLLRAWRIYDGIDPCARKVLDAQDPWDAYNAAYECIGVMEEAPRSLPMREPILISWMWGVDVFELEEATPEVAHGVLRRMASEWLRRPTDPDEGFIRRWAADSKAAIVEVSNVK